MTAEYWLQKKTIGGWSVVTWYDNQEQAEKNYNECIKNVGYAWRLVKVEVMSEQRLEEEKEIIPPVIQPVQFIKKTLDPWQAAPQSENQMAINPWGATMPSVSDPSPTKSEHGLSGSVWLVHRGLKIKGRFAADKVDAMMAQGYERGGPRTQL